MQNPSGIVDKTGQNTSSSQNVSKEAKAASSTLPASAAGAQGASSESVSKKEGAAAGATSNSGGALIGSRATTGNGTASKKDLRKQQTADEAASATKADPATQAPVPPAAQRTAGQTATSGAAAEPLSQQLYCICRTPDETNMICCDRCEEWYHFHCVGIKPEQIAEYDNKPFYCQYSKTCMELQKKNKQSKATEKAEEDKRVKAARKAEKKAEKDQRAQEKAQRRKTGGQNSGASQTPQQQSANVERKKVAGNQESKQPSGSNANNAGVESTSGAPAGKNQTANRAEVKASKDESRLQAQAQP